MAITSTGYQSPATSREGLKPSVLDQVIQIGAYDTPILSKAGRSSVTSLTHSWITDHIGSPAKNAKLEISDFVGDQKSTKQKTTNAVQIFTEDVMVSKSMQKMATYGGNELAYEVAKKAKKHALDLEYSFWGLGRDASLYTSVFKAPTTRTDSVAGEAAGIFHYLAKGATTFTNGKRGNEFAFDADGDWGASDTDDTKTTLTETQLNQLLQNIWDSGETPTDVFVGASLKKAINAMVTRQLGNEAKSNRRVTSLETDFGTINIHLHRFLSTAYGLDDVLLAGNFEYLKFGTLYDTVLEDVNTSKTAAAKRYYTEGTWEVRNADAFAIGVGLKA